MFSHKHLSSLEYSLSSVMQLSKIAPSPGYLKRSHRIAHLFFDEVRSIFLSYSLHRFLTWTEKLLPISLNTLMWTPRAILLTITLMSSSHLCSLSHYFNSLVSICSLKLLLSLSLSCYSTLWYFRSVPCTASIIPLRRLSDSVPNVRTMCTLNCVYVELSKRDGVRGHVLSVTI